MSVCFSVSMNEGIHLALVKAMEATRKKRNEYVVEAVKRCLKHDGYIEKDARGYEEIKELA